MTVEIKMFKCTKWGQIKTVEIKMFKCTKWWQIKTVEIKMFKGVANQDSRNKDVQMHKVVTNQDSRNKDVQMHKWWQIKTVEIKMFKCTKWWQIKTVEIKMFKCTKWWQIKTVEIKKFKCTKWWQIKTVEIKMFKCTKWRHHSLPWGSKSVLFHVAKKICWCMTLKKRSGVEFTPNFSAVRNRQKRWNSQGAPLLTDTHTHTSLSLHATFSTCHAASALLYGHIPWQCQGWRDRWEWISYVNLFRGKFRSLRKITSRQVAFRIRTVCDRSLQAWAPVAFWTILSCVWI